MTLAPQPVATERASTLRGAADRLADLPHTRVNAVDLHRALIRSAPSYAQARDALNALHAYLRTLDDGDRWLHIGGGSQSRDLAAGRLRAAAEHVDPSEEVSL